MKKLTVAIALLLCVVFCVFSFASCSKKNKKKDPEPSNTATDVTTDRWEVLGPEVKAALSEDARTFTIQLSAYGDAEKTSKNDKYVAGPDKREGADTIGQKVYDRNTKAEQLLGVDATYTYWDETDLGWGKQAGKIVTLVTTKAPDMPDVFVDMLYDLNKAMLSDGVFKDILSLPGSYFDFSSSGWMKEWMDSLSFTGDRFYILGGDYFMDIFRNMGVLPFNADLMDENASKLAPALLGEDLAAGETMSQRFFDFVEDEKWTWEALGKLCEAIWVDGGTAGQSDFNDTLGIIAESYSGMPSALMLYSAGVSIVQVEKNPVTGVQTLSYPSESSILGDIFDAVAGVFNGEGTLVTTHTGSNDEPGVAEHYAKFAENTLLFADPSLLGTLEDDVFQQMTSLYSVVPLPKVSVDNKYNTVIHNTADVGAINVHVSQDKARAISAYLQYCAEHTAEIRTEFLEIVTKFKTTVYNQGTDRMLDLIYDSVINARDKALDDAVDCIPGGRELRFHSMMKDGKYKRGSDYIVTDYASTVQSKQSIVNDILDKWMALPTASTETPEETPAPEEAPAE